MLVGQVDNCKGSACSDKQVKLEVDFGEFLHPLYNSVATQYFSDNKDAGADYYSQGGVQDFKSMAESYFGDIK